MAAGGLSPPRPPPFSPVSDDLSDEVFDETELPSSSSEEVELPDEPEGGGSGASLNICALFLEVSFGTFFKITAPTIVAVDFPGSVPG